MAEVVLFHHVMGLTDGVRDLADRLAGAGHRVHTPDLYQGTVADSLETGFEVKNRICDEELAARTDRALDGLGPGLVYAGLSLGVMAAQRLAQTRPDARGALLYEACLPTTGDWPSGVPVQVHGMGDDEFFAHDGDLDAARELVASVGAERGELFVYPGDRHLFSDSSLPSFDAAATALVVERSLAFLDRIG